jgi:glycosyltransferase involved in cell wall biosynthesis
MTIRTLSILIPCYNEERLIPIILSKLVTSKLDNGIEKEIIIVDDASTDNTSATIKEFITANNNLSIKFTQHEVNKGKGAAIHTAISQITGEVAIIQDADLEYDPFEYNKLLKPITDGHADVVYGSRFRGGEAHRVLFFFHTIGNKFLTFCSNVFTGLNISDMETGYKMIKTDILKNIRLKEKRFGFEPEITAKLSRVKKIRIYEVGISYYGRNYSDGKKIGWKDGVHALWCIVKYNLFSRS